MASPPIVMAGLVPAISRLLAVATVKVCRLMDSRPVGRRLV
jgi:hypothetical protein